MPLEGETDRRGWEWYYLLTNCHPEVCTLYHPGNTIYAAWSPDGKYIATPGAVWNANSGECIRRFMPSLTLSSEVAWSPNSNLLAWRHVSDDDAIYIWDRQTDAVRELRGNQESTHCLDFSPDGTQLASGSLDNTVKVWDINTRVVVRSYQTNNGVSDVAWQPRGEFLAAAAEQGGGVYLWSIATGETVARLKSPDENHHWLRIAWHPTRQTIGRYLAPSLEYSWRA